jgi:hypothetical protein
MLLIDDVPEFDVKTGLVQATTTANASYSTKIGAGEVLSVNFCSYNCRGFNASKLSQLHCFVAG